MPIVSASFMECYFSLLDFSDRDRSINNGSVKDFAIHSFNWRGNLYEFFNDFSTGILLLGRCSGEIHKCSLVNFALIEYFRSFYSNFFYMFLIVSGDNISELTGYIFI